MRSFAASHTARGIARGVAIAGLDPACAALLPHGAAALTERLLGFRAGRCDALRYALFERAFMPGARVHIALRKHWFDERVRAAIAGGAGQVVVLGAGFDVLCARLAPAFPDVAFLEVDHPATQASKRVALERAGALATNLHLVAADLAREALSAALAREPAFGARVRSAFAAEGLLMYLAPDAVDALFAAVRATAGAGGTFLFSAVEADPSGRPRIGRRRLAVRALLRLAGEPFRSALGRSALGAFLAKRGFGLVDAAHDAELLARLPDSLRPASCAGLDWEFVAEARLGA